MASNVSTRKSLARAFIPMRVWFWISLPLFALDFHWKNAPKTHLNFSVFIDGKYVEARAYSATCGGKPLSPGERVDIGWKKIRIEAKDVQPFEKKMLVFYGRNELGEIHLQRLHGMLELKLEPPALGITGTGPYHEFSISKTSTLTSSIPVGEYHLTANYGFFNETTHVQVLANQTNRYDWRAKVGAVWMDSDPSGATFILAKKSDANIRRDGITPIHFPTLPVGEYHLTIWRGDYQKSQSFRVNFGETNLINTVFEYGTVQFTSDKEIGQTPFRLSLKPGNYQFRFKKVGFHDETKDIAISGQEEVNIEINLTSRRYTQALENARQEFARREYNLALRAVADALTAKKGDAEATDLKQKIQVALHLDLARQYGQERKFSDAIEEAQAALKLAPHDRTAQELKNRLEDQHKAFEESAAKAKAEARKLRPEKVFLQLTDKIRNSHLADPKGVRIKSSVKDVRETVRAALAAEPKWKILTDKDVEPEIFYVEAEYRNVFLGNRFVVLVGGQSADNEVLLFYRVWAFSLGKNINLNTVGRGPLIYDESYEPVDDSAKRLKALQEFEAQLARELEKLP
jgi:hypothetical protein